MPESSSSNNVIKKVLSNGLTVLFKEDHSNPVVGVNVWFRVGSVNETSDESGLAHFQEHMVFKGTERHAVGDIANLVKSAGGNLNASTSYSYTMYYIVLPSKAFSLALDVQADAMMNSTFDADEFQKERLVVIEEARMYDDTPDSYTFYRTMELGYKVHNYRRPIAGYEEVVRKFSRDQLLDFYNRYYRPGNAVLVVVGDVDPDTAFAEIEKVYGGWKNGRVEVHQSDPEPPQKKFRFKMMRGAIDHAYLGAGFHVPSILDKDYPALEMLATLLSSGKSSRLYRRVREEKHLATTVSAELLAEKWPGFFLLFASTPGEKWEPLLEAVFNELAAFQTDPARESELLKARRQVERSMFSELETVEGQASNLGYYEVLDDYKLAEQHREAIRAVTAEEVMNVARKYFAIENCSLATYLPNESSIAEKKQDEIEGLLTTILRPSAPVETGARALRTAVPALSQTRPNGRKAGNVAVQTLDNGLKVLVKQRSTVPMVAMLAIVEGGTRLEPQGKSGLSVLGTRALLKGTKSYSAEDIVNTIEGLGGSIESFSSFDVTGAYLSVLSEHLHDAVPVFKEVVRAPKLDGERVEQEKSRLLKELSKRHDHPVHFSMDNLFGKVFGEHPYAHPYVGDESQLAMLTEKDCRDWYSRILTPENVTLTFVGDISNDKALEVAQNLFGDLTPSQPPTPELPAPENPRYPGRHQLERPNLKQAVGLVGFVAPEMMTDEAIALSVLNGIMTGLGGRLFVELRDKRSFGYMAGSSFMPLKERSIFFAYTNPGPENIEEALDVIMTELSRVTTEPVSDEELTRSKEWLVGTQTMRMQRNLAQAMEYGTYETLGFGHDTVNKMPELIQRVTKKDIQRVAAKVFDNDKAVFVKLVPEEEEVATE